jgi:hypothetical protein
MDAIAPSRDLASGDTHTLISTFYSTIDDQARRRGKPEPSAWNLFNEAAAAVGEDKPSFANQVASSILEAGIAALKDHQKGRARFLVCSAPTGSGKSSGAHALTAAIIKAYPNASVTFACETIQQCEAAYWGLREAMELVGCLSDPCLLTHPKESWKGAEATDARGLSERLVIYTGAHDLNKDWSEILASYPNFEPTRDPSTGHVVTRRFRRADLAEARVAVVTHNMLLSGKSGENGRTYQGRPRTVTFVDEQINEVAVHDITVGDVFTARDWAAGKFGGSQFSSADIALKSLADYLTAAWETQRPGPGKDFRSLEAAMTFDTNWFWSSQADEVIRRGDESPEAKVVSFARCLAQGYAFMARIGGSDRGGRFIGYQTALKPTPGTIVMDATADLSNVSKLSIGHAPVPTPRATFENLTVKHLTIPEGTLPKGPVSKLVKMAKTARPYARWIRETVIENTEAGERALVVVHKGLIGHELFPEPEPGKVYADIEGRLVAFCNWGQGVGSNRWKEADVVFLMGEFHRPKWSTVAIAIGLMDKSPGEYLRKVDTPNSREEVYVSLKEGHLARWEAQLAMRGNARNLSLFGECGKQRLYLTAEFERFNRWKDMLFPGATFDFAESRKVIAKRRGGGKALAEFLDSYTGNAITAKEACESAGADAGNLNRFLRDPDMSLVMDRHSWHYAKGKGRAPSLFLKGQALKEWSDAQDLKQAALTGDF